MFRFIFCFLILANTLTAFADNINFSNQYPYSNNFNSKLKMNQPKNIISEYKTHRRPLYNYNKYHPSYKSYLSNSNLSALEKYILNKTFKKENEIQRLERLEDLAFGAIQNGDLVSRYHNVENAILSRPKHNTKVGLLNNLSNYFAGQATGFTPNILPYSAYDNFGGFSTYPSMYSPKFGNTKFEQYSNGIFGGGWGMSNGNFGSGSSIRILD